MQRGEKLIHSLSFFGDNTLATWNFRKVDRVFEDKFSVLKTI